MLEKILKMNGATKLSASDQREVKGGLVQLARADAGWCRDVCSNDTHCPGGQECFTGTCDGASTKMCRHRP
jgi:hypothetical protein